MKTSQTIEPIRRDMARKRKTGVELKMATIVSETRTTRGKKQRYLGSVLGWRVLLSDRSLAKKLFIVPRRITTTELTGHGVGILLLASFVVLTMRDR